MIGFERRRNFMDFFFNTTLVGLQGELDARQSERLKRIRNSWNFYEGYHWEELPEQDTPQLTSNYCRLFVDKFVAFELGKMFSLATSNAMEDVVVNSEGNTMFEFLTEVWKYNKQQVLITEIGQMKSVTGEAWVQVRYDDADEIEDPYGEYPDGQIKLVVMPTSVVFPEFDQNRKENLLKLTIMYMYEALVKTPILGKTRKEQVLYKQVWTNDEVSITDGKNEPVVYPNKYGTIPFIQIKNLILAGRTEGRSDLEDLIPLNTEYNMKESNVSEIIDYHSAPVTIVYGARIGNLEKGANKMWGGLNKDAKVENLELKSDLSASSNYIANIKTSMCEIGGIPEAAIGGNQAISNTSGVALQFMNMPLIDKTNLKKASTETGLEEINKLIILVATLEGLITKPEGISNKDYFKTEVTLPNTLPKDMLLELQQIQQEMLLGLEDRANAMKRLGKENVEERILEIDEDRETHPEIYTGNNAEINSGMINGQTPVEQVRKETTGANGNPSGKN